MQKLDFRQDGSHGWDRTSCIASPKRPGTAWRREVGQKIHMGTQLVAAGTSEHGAMCVSAQSVALVMCECMQIPAQPVRGSHLSRASGQLRRLLCLL